MKKYAVKNPYASDYKFFDTREEAVTIACEYAYQLINVHTHGFPYTMVIFNDDGSQTWYNPSGDELTFPEEYKEYIRNLIPQPSE